MVATLFTPSAGTLNANDTNTSTSFRILCTPSIASNGSLQVTFQAASTPGLAIGHASFGKWDGNTTTGADTTATPIELKFSGVSGFSIAAGASITSDLTAHAGFSLSTSDKVVVIFDTSTPGGTRIRTGNSNVDMFFNAGSASWNLSNPPLHTKSAGTDYAVVSIETNSAGTPASASPTGNGLTVSIGTASVVGKASTSVTGNALTVSAGDPLWPNVSTSPTGNSLPVSVGTVTVSTPAGGSAPAFRAVSSTTFGNVSDTIVAKPTGTVDGDIMVACVAMFRVGGTTAPVVPSGWTQIGSYQILLHPSSTLTSRVGIWWKRASSEPSSYTWAQFESASTQGTIQAWSGCASSGSPIDGFSAATTIGGTATGTGITTAIDNEKLLFICQNFDATGTLSPPTGMTERYDNLIYLSDETIATAGATGNRTQTLATTTGLWTAFMVALTGGSGAVNASASPTGNAMTASVGTVTAGGATNASASPTGNALGASVGTVTVSTPVPTPIIEYMAGGLYGGGYVVDSRDRDFAMLGFYLTRSAAAAAGVTLVGVTGNALTATVGNQNIASANRLSVTGNALAVSVGGAFVPELTVPPVFRSVASVPYQDRANVSNVAKPDFTTDGDLLLASMFFAASVDPGDVVTSSGWTAVTTSTVVNQGGFFGRFQVFWKRAGPTEPATYDFNHAGLTLTTQVAIEAWSGVLRVGNPVNVFSTASGTGTTSTAASVTTTVANTALVWTGHNWTAAGAATPPSGYTERFDSIVTTSDRDGTSAGATGSVVTTPNGNAGGTDPWQAWLVALLPSTSSQMAVGAIGSETTLSVGTVTVSITASVGITLVKSAKGTSTAATTTAAFATAPTAGNLIVMGFATNDYNATPNAGWTQSGGAFNTATSMEQQTFHGGYLWWRISNGTNSFPYTIGSATNSAWVLAEFTGIDSSPYDVSAGQRNTGTISSYTTPPVTPHVGNRLLVAGINGSLDANLSAITVGGWTNLFTAIDSIGTGGAGTNDIAGLAYRVVTSTGATAYSTGATFSSGSAMQSQTGLIIAFGKAVTVASPTGNGLTASVGTVSVRTVQNVFAAGSALGVQTGGFSVDAGGAVNVRLGSTVGPLTVSTGTVIVPLNNAWNPATLFGPGTLSNTDRTLNAPASASLSRVFSTKTHGTGKYYTEVTVGGPATGAVGFTDLTAEGVTIDLATGKVLEGTTLISTFPPIVSGDVIGMAMNADTGRCWFRVNGGLWNNDADQSPEFGDDPTVEFPNAATVGHTNAPGYPGHLTTYTGGDNNIIRTTQRFDFMDFDGCTILAPNCVFYGCRFRSNWTDGWNIKVDVDAALAATFQFCTIEPTSATIPNPAWPSAGTGINGIDGISSPSYVPYMIPYANSYQFGILQSQGGIVVEDCNIWGWGNSIVLFGTWQKTIERCWIHDASNEGLGTGNPYHQDGPGHLDGGGCDNVLIKDCTIASIGNTNGIAFQAGSNGYHNIVVRHNYLSGFGACVDMCHNATGNSGLQFINNVLATDVAWGFGPLYADFSGQFRASSPTNIWSGNTLRVYPGSISRPNAHPVFTAADNGKFVWPDVSFRTTDWVP